MPLSDAKVRTLKAKAKTYKLLDYEGLYIEVRPSGRKYWRYRFNLKGGKEGIYTIGEYPGITLSSARKQRDIARAQAKQNINPNQARKQREAQVTAQNVNTFAAIEQSFSQSKRESWSLSYVSQYDRIMKNDILPVIGTMPIATIEAAHILVILEKINSRGAVTIAANAKMHISRVFRFAAGQLLVTYDPTHLLAEAIIRKPVKSHASMPRGQLSALCRKMDSYSGHAQTRLALLILSRTFVRTIELRRAQWPEIDFNRAIWTVPAEHTKKRRTHIVPLSTQVLAWLQALKQITGHSINQHLFPNARRPDDFMSSRAINQALYNLGYEKQFSGHGFRSTASTILNEEGWNADAIERQLAHMESKGERRAYNHAQYLEERKQMMQWWSDFLEQALSGG
ncbi:MAG: tyrosine-type recombinase/integrase [Pontibacterium sp.]